MLNAFLIITCSIVFSFHCFADKAGSIKSVEFPGDKKIYFGPLLENQTSRMRFAFANYLTDRTLLMYNKAPTYIKMQSPNSPLIDIESFDTAVATVFPLVMSPALPYDTLTMAFNTTPAAPATLGRKEAMLILGMVPQDDTLTPIILDTFYLIGKKTDLYIDWYDDILNFDSVFVDREAYSIEWKAKNTTTDGNYQQLNALAQEYSLLSPMQHAEDEFVIEQKQYPLAFYQGNSSVYQAWDMAYKPLDANADSAMLYLLFKPDAANDPDRIDTAKLKLKGIGVYHSLDIVRSEADIIADTINFGELRIGSSRGVQVALKNSGNINYGLKNQMVYDEYDDSPDANFHIIEPFMDGIPVLLTGDTASFAITFSPDKKGNCYARYILKNNFIDRPVHSASSKDYEKIFILKGVGVEPILSVISDTVDFGNVSYSNSDETCPAEKDTVITIENTGNAVLIISNILSENALFRLDKTNLSIPANGTAKLKITYISVYPEKKNTARLLFITNEIKRDTFVMTLIGNSISPISANLHIPALKNKPGTQLKVPIILKSENDAVSKYAKSYSFNLAYNPSLLGYYNRITLNTASEGCELDIVEEKAGLLSVKTETSDNKFLANDTLLWINFNTYLGNLPSTEIAVQNAEVGNGNCDDFMRLQVENGKYSIDSICGLEYKLNDAPKSKYDFRILSTQPIADNLEVEFTTIMETACRIEIFNAFGKRHLESDYWLPAGSYQKSIDISTLPSGIFVIHFSSCMYHKPLSFVLVR